MMNRHAAQTLDSLQLAKYSVQVRCVICAGDNMFDADRCRHCGAPMTISMRSADTKRSADSKRPAPQFFAALGGEDSGKTTYLAMMVDMLSRRASTPQLIARGAYAVGQLRELLHQLRHCRFPDPTDVSAEKWNWLHGTLNRTRKPPIDIVIPDFSGETIGQEVETPRSNYVIRAYLAQSKAALVFLDAARLAVGDASAVEEAMEIISYLSELPKDPKTAKKLKGDVYLGPVAIVLTKADSLERGVTAREFVKGKASALVRHCEERLKTFEFFAVSVVSATIMEGATCIPLRVEPRGVEAPIAWLAEQL